MPCSQHRPSVLAPAALPARATLAAMALAGFAMSAVADGPAAALEGALEDQVRRLALDGSRAAPLPGGTMPRVEVVVGQLDPRLRLAPCPHVEPYLPDGTRPWGKSRIGLRCLDGVVRWNVSLPITVKVWGPALVSAGGGAAGSVVGAADLAVAEVDLAEDASPALVDPQAAVGRTLARTLKPGQSLRAAHLKARQWFGAGETVTVVTQGDGYAVAGEAQALNPGIEGTPVRVRTESGRILTGMPIAERRVDLGP